MPTIPAVEKSAEYRVGTGTSRITIHAKVGSAQRGVPVALLVDEANFLPAKTLNDSTEEFDAGLGAELIGRVLRVQTLVTDDNKKTDLTIVNYEISGGLQLVKDHTQLDAETGGRVAHFFWITIRA